jgi:hypothetical protein
MSKCSDSSTKCYFQASTFTSLKSSKLTSSNNLYSTSKSNKLFNIWCQVKVWNMPWPVGSSTSPASESLKQGSFARATLTKITRLTWVLWSNGKEANWSEIRTSHLSSVFTLRRCDKNFRLHSPLRSQSWLSERTHWTNCIRNWKTWFKDQKISTITRLGIALLRVISACMWSKEARERRRWIWVT